MNTQRLLIELARTERRITGLRRDAKARLGTYNEKLWPPSWQHLASALKRRARDLRRAIFDPDAQAMEPAE